MLLSLHGFQRQIVFHLERYGNDHSFNVPLLLEFSSRIADDVFLEAVSRISQTFPELASSLYWNRDHWVLRQTRTSCSCDVNDVGNDKSALDFLVKVRSSKLFDLTTGPLARFSLIHYDGKSLILAVIHHLVTDGYSQDMLSSLIPQALSGSRLDQFRSQFEQVSLTGPDLVNSQGAVVPFRVGTRGEGALHRFTLTRGRSLAGVAAKLRVTVSELVFAACARALSSMRGNTNLMFGIPVANRHSDEQLSMLGCHTAVMPLEVCVTAGMPLNTLLREVRNAFSSMRDACPARSDSPVQPAYDTLYSFREFHAQTSGDWGEQAVGSLSENRLFDRFGLCTPCKLPLSILVERYFDRRHPDTDEVSIAIEYEASHYGEETIEELSRRLLTHIEEVIGHGSGDTQQHALTSPPPPAVEKIRRYPGIRVFDDALNVKCHDAAEVEAKVAELKARLRSQGIRTLILESRKSFETVCMIFACYEEGICYVPIDKRLSHERKMHIYSESGADAVAGDEDGNLRIRSLPDKGKHPIQEDIQYVIYTSGSTGRPKGVMVSRAGLDRLIDGMIQTLALGEGCNVLSYANLFFDMSVPDLYLPYRLGGQLSLIDDALKVRRYELKAAIEAVRPDVLQMTPTALSVFTDRDLATLPATHLILGGEAVPARYRPRLFRAVQHMWNFYGPTEAIVWCAYSRMTDSSVTDIAHALPGYTVEISSDGRPCLPYERGEIQIGGNIAAGYVDSAQNTGKFFDAAGGSGGAKIYASGDAGELIPGQGIRIFGRLDCQVKINGHRIELGDVDAALERVPGVREALSYFSPEEGVLGALLLTDPQTTVEMVRTTVSKALPESMVPTDMFMVSKLPMTANGKKDRSPEGVKTCLQQGGTGPASPSQPPRAASAAVTAAPVPQVLDVLERHLGPLTDRLNLSFYQAGGNSLKAIAIVRALKSTQRNVHVGMLLEQPTLEDFINTIGTT